MNHIEINHDIGLSNNFAIQQKNFLESKLGQVINQGINIGLKYVLPDVIENEIIEIKDTLIKNGLSEGVKKAIDSAINLGKSVLGIITGNFENIGQVQNAIKKGGIIDSVGEIIDKVVTTSVDKGVISTSIGRTIQRGKNTILNTVSNHIENEFQSQLNNIEKLEKYENNWKQYYKDHNFDEMQREYEKIQEKLKEITPIENTIKEARVISNIHQLIKNNGKNFDLSEEALELAKQI